VKKFFGVLILGLILALGTLTVLANTASLLYEEGEEAFNGSIQWNGEAWEVKMLIDGATVILVFDSGIATIDGVAVELDVPAQLVGYRFPIQLYQSTIQATQDPALVGVWAWVGNREWTYNLNQNGTGSRGTTDTSMSFSWGTLSNGILWIDNGEDTPEGIYRIELWEYNISGDVLTIESTQISNVIFSYIRLMSPLSTPSPTPVSAPLPTPIPTIAPTPQQEQASIVFWVPNGSVYHTNQDCSSLARSRDIRSGTRAESGMPRRCQRC